MEVIELRHLLEVLRGEGERHLPVMYKDQTGSLHEIRGVEVVPGKFILIREVQNASLS